MDNLWVIDLTTFDDLDQQPEDQDRDCAWKLKETKGDSPGALSHHTSVVYNDKMYLFGGSYASGEQNPDFYSLTIDKLAWTVIKNVSHICTQNLFSNIER